MIEYLYKDPAPPSLCCWVCRKVIVQGKMSKHGMFLHCNQCVHSDTLEWVSISESIQTQLNNLLVWCPFDCPDPIRQGDIETHVSTHHNPVSITITGCCIQHIDRKAKSFNPCHYFASLHEQLFKLCKTYALNHSFRQCIQIGDFFIPQWVTSTKPEFVTLAKNYNSYTLQGNLPKMNAYLPFRNHLITNITLSKNNNQLIHHYTSGAQCITYLEPELKNESKSSMLSQQTPKQEWEGSISIKIPGCDKYQVLFVKHTTFIRTIKHSLAREYNIYSSHYNLYYNNTRLKTFSQLQYYSIQPNSVIQLIFVGTRSLSPLTHGNYKCRHNHCSGLRYYSAFEIKQHERDSLFHCNDATEALLQLVKSKRPYKEDEDINLHETKKAKIETVV